MELLFDFGRVFNPEFGGVGLTGEQMVFLFEVGITGFDDVSWVSEVTQALAVEGVFLFSS